MSLANECREDINIQYMALPYDVKGISFPNEDGSFTIIINNRVPEEQHLKIYQHELKHIINRDFGCDNVDQAEHCAHFDNNVF